MTHDAGRMTPKGEAVFTGFVICHLSFVITAASRLSLEGQARCSIGAVPSQVIEGFRLNETKDGRTVYDLTAERAYVYNDSNRIDVTRPSVRFYDENQCLFSTLTADSGCVHSRTSDLVARHNVHVETRDSTILNTDSLAWCNRDQIVQTDAAIDLRSPHGNVTGMGLVSDAGLKRIEVKNAVQGTTTYDFNH